jgi:hypothetical protein
MFVLGSILPGTGENATVAQAGTQLGWHMLASVDHSKIGKTPSYHSEVSCCPTAFGVGEKLID